MAIINRTMAERYWPGASPLGKRVRLGGTEVWREVVGMVADARNWGLDRPVNPEVYLPVRQLPWTTVFFVVATDANATPPVPAMREALRAVDPDFPLSNLRTMEDVARRSTALRQSTMILLSVFGALALVLATAGIYGVMAHLVALRTGEIGVRMTLGAKPSDVLKLLLREGTVQALAGLAIGLTGGVLVMRSMRSLLFEVAPAESSHAVRRCSAADVDEPARLLCAGAPRHEGRPRRGAAYVVRQLLPAKAGSHTSLRSRLRRPRQPSTSLVASGFSRKAVAVGETVFAR